MILGVGTWISTCETALKATINILSTRIKVWIKRAFSVICISPLGSPFMTTSVMWTSAEPMSTLEKGPFIYYVLKHLEGEGGGLENGIFCLFPVK